jgi:ATP-binding cassette subfamily F protein 3
MIELKKISLSRGQKQLLDQANLTINPGEKVGLVGSNGTGKSTLLTLLRGELKEDAGELYVPKNWAISSVFQELEQSEITALDYVLQGDDRYYQVQQDLLKAEAEENIDQLMALHEEMDRIDGYRATARAAELLYGLGFSTKQQQQATESFSGGWQMRLNLARALMKPCQLLLLDEPTNHLDMDAIFWLERWILRFPGTVIVIAHDSVFLDKVVNKIVSLEDLQFLSHRGNYTDFMRWRAEKLAMQQKIFEQQQQKVQHLQSFIARFKAKASKAKQAQSRMKMLARMDIVASVQASSPFQFKLQAATDCPNPVLQLNDVFLGYGEKTILKKLRLHLGPADRIGLLGANGAGKSTLIKALAGDLEVQQGEILKSPKLKIGYFAQHQVDALNLEETPFWHIAQHAPRIDQQVIRSFLGSFGFAGDKAFEQVGVFSGGEKARLVLALLAWQKPHLLLLDEPTNHLDLEMREALALALQEFEGAVVVVSHDRQLLGSVVDQFWLVHEGNAVVYDDDLDSYSQWMLTQRKLQAATEQTVKKDSKAQTLHKLEQQIKTVQKELTQPSATLNKKNKTHEEEKKALEAKLAELEEQWYRLIDDTALDD